VGLLALLLLLVLLLLAAAAGYGQRSQHPSGCQALPLEYCLGLNNNINDKLL
jgi:hypothetical protein